MRAVGELAAVDEGADVAKETVDFFGDHVPQLKLANPGGVDQVTAVFQRDQFGGRRGVAAFLIFVADRAHAKLKARFDRIQNRGFADAGLAGDDTVATGNKRSEPVDARACLG